MKPQFITFTGVDTYTSFEGMEELSAIYPIEWGVLFSPSRQGIEHRYPGPTAVRKLIKHNERGNLRLAAHLCGDHSRRIMKHDLPEGLPVALDEFERIQVNHVDPIPSAIADFANHYIARVVTQSRSLDWPAQWSGFDYLFDRSGGRGEVPTAWPANPGHNRLVGYAGGISPETITGVMSVLGQMNGLYWIDMETGVRTDDVLDLKKCRAVCEAVFGARP